MWLWLVLLFGLGVTNHTWGVGGHGGFSPFVFLLFDHYYFYYYVFFMFYIFLGTVFFFFFFSAFVRLDTDEAWVHA